MESSSSDLLASYNLNPSEVCSATCVQTHPTCRFPLPLSPLIPSGSRITNFTFYCSHTLWNAWKTQALVQWIRHCWLWWSPSPPPQVGFPSVSSAMKTPHRFFLCTTRWTGSNCRTITDLEKFAVFEEHLKDTFLTTLLANYPNGYDLTCNALHQIPVLQMVRFCFWFSFLEGEGDVPFLPQNILWCLTQIWRCRVQGIFIKWQQRWQAPSATASQGTAVVRSSFSVFGDFVCL